MTLYSTHIERALKCVREPDEFRKNVADKLNSIVENETKAINIERSIYNWTIKYTRERRIIQRWNNSEFVLLYMNRLKSIVYNLKNTDLLDRLKSGEIKGYQIGQMSHMEMCPDKWKVLLDEQKERMKYEGDNGLVPNTDEFVCPRCKSRRCYFTEQNTRSADEAGVIFITCLECGKNWKR
jgi:DNA-directed RNA polymerase subunit M/transcription elongation factor TFIIS